MPATLIGTTGNWAFEDAEAGLLVESLDYNYQTKEKTVLDHRGETVGLSLYDETVEVSLKGLVNGFTGKLASTLALANAIPAHLVGAVTGRNVVKSIRRSLAQEDFDKIEIGSVMYPLIAAA